MESNELSVIGPVVVLGAVSGARSMTAIATVARARAHTAAANDAVFPSQSLGPRVVRKVGRVVDSKLATAATGFALLEMMADKAPNIPNRVDPGPMFGRVAAGAVVGGAIAQMTGSDRRLLAACGAVAAFAGAHLSFRFRRALGESIPPFFAGLVEDAAVIGVARLGGRLLESRTRVTAAQDQS